MQKNWIGRSEGLALRFMLDPATSPNGESELEIFTTRPDTLFGAKFMAISPDPSGRITSVGTRFGPCSGFISTTMALNGSEPPLVSMTSIVPW